MSKRRERNHRESEERTRMPDELIAGRHSILEALNASTPIRKILIAEGLKQADVIEEIRRLARSRGVHIEVTERSALDRMVQAVHQGVVAIVERFEYADFDELVLQRGRLLLLDGVTDPANLGSILRSVDAFGWSGVLIPRHRAVAVTPTVRKVAAGAAERIPVAHVGSPAETVTRLKRLDYVVYGLDPEGELEYIEADYSPPVGVVLGAEGKGLGRLVKERCDALIRIPMKGTLGSINVAVSAAVVMSRSP